MTFPVTLITGASGNLGSLLARRLVGEGRDLARFHSDRTSLLLG